MISTLLMMLSCVLFFIAATNWVPEPSKPQVISAGLFCWVLSELMRGLIK